MGVESPVSLFSRILTCLRCLRVAMLSIYTDLDGRHNPLPVAISEYRNGTPPKDSAPNLLRTGRHWPTSYFIIISVCIGSLGTNPSSKISLVFRFNRKENPICVVSTEAAGVEDE